MSGIALKWRVKKSMSEVDRLLDSYLDFTTKRYPSTIPGTSISTEDPEYPQLVQDGQALPRPWKDYQPAYPGVHLFGHVALATADHAPTDAARIKSAQDYWRKSTEKHTKKAHHLVFSFAREIPLRLASRGVPVDAYLMAATLRALTVYEARWYGMGAIGGAIGVHFDTYYPHCHVLLHPLQRSGKTICISRHAQSNWEGKPTRIDFQGALLAAFRDEADALMRWSTTPTKEPSAAVGEQLRNQQLVSILHKPVILNANNHVDAPGDWLAKEMTSNRLAKYFGEDAPALKTPDQSALIAKVEDGLNLFRKDSAAIKTSWTPAVEEVKSTLSEILSHQASSPAIPRMIDLGGGLTVQTDCSVSFMRREAALSDSQESAGSKTNGPMDLEATRSAFRQRVKEAEKREADLVARTLNGLVELRRKRDALWLANANAELNDQVARALKTKSVPECLSCGPDRILPTFPEAVARWNSHRKRSAERLNQLFRPATQADVGRDLAPFATWTRNLAPPVEGNGMPGPGSPISYQRGSVLVAKPEMAPLPADPIVPPMTPEKIASEIEKLKAELAVELDR